MKAVLLSAVDPRRGPLALAHGTVETELALAGYDDVRVFDLLSMKLAFCQGEFDCWVKTPGVCRSHDEEADIIAAAHDADALVLLGPLAFGGHGHVVKRAVDRLLALLLPFFEKRDALTHHEVRYPKRPRLFSIACAARASAAERETFAALNDANAVNFAAPGCGAAVLDEARPESWSSAIASVLSAPRAPGAAITGRGALREALFTAARADAGAVGPETVRRVALLVGSHKPKGTSVSETLARGLIRRLSALSVPTELHFAQEFVHDDARAAERARAISACDVLILVTPLYVDSFPALATNALEHVARERATHEARPEPRRFAAVVSCGFPEAEQNRTALRIARHFADAAGYSWGGGLALGGGGVVRPGDALDAAQGPVGHIVRALDLAAPPLAAGRALPDAAIAAMAEAPLPDALYRVMGDLGWRWAAHGNDVPQRDLRGRPLDPPNG